MLKEGYRLVRLIAAISALGVLASACGGRPEVFAADDAQLRAAGAAFDELELPEAIPAVPAFIVESRKVFDGKELAALSKTKGAAIVVPVAVHDFKVSSAKSSAKLRVAAVPPIELRSVAPPSTRNADFVWFALVGGDAVMTPAASKKLKLGTQTEISTKDLGEVSVGALADNGTPNFADVLVSTDGFERFGAPNVAIVGAESGVTLNGLAQEIRKSVPSAKVSWLLPKTQTVATQAAVSSSTVISVPSVAGMHPAMAQAVGQLVAASQGRIWIVSGYRDSARQYQLWMQALEKYGDPEVANNWVAPPGRSYHERGLAADLGGDLNLAVKLIQEMNLPLWRPMSWEPWHFELAGSRG